MIRFARTTQKTGRARTLRDQSTFCERLVWSNLRSAQVEGASFRRQHPLGSYIVDFYCAALGIAVELDGGQHGETQHAAKDKRRDRDLHDRGILVLRFWNSDVTENLDGVMETIRQAVLSQRALLTPSHPPPFRGRGRPAFGATTLHPLAATPPPERGRTGGGPPPSNPKLAKQASPQRTPPPERGRTGGGPPQTPSAKPKP